MSACVRALTEELTAGDEPLFAVMDAGRDPEILTVLMSHNAPCRSLYSGESEAKLGPSGPFLAELADEPALLEELLRRGWGRAWGIFVGSSADFDAVRKHLRSLLMVRRQKDGSELYFRFYDPRVLRAFLPTCSPEQVRAMFGPLSVYLTEGVDQDTLLRFRQEGGSVERETVDLSHLTWGSAS